jgi:hypothetical protein
MNNKNKKQIFSLLKSLLGFLCIASVVLCFAAPAFAGDGYSSAVEGLETSGVKLPTFSTSGHAQASYEPGASNISSAILYVVDLMKYLMGGVTVMMLIAIGVNMVVAGKKIDEVAPKMKEALKYVMIGLVVVIMSGEIIKTVFFGESGEVYRSETDIKAAAQAGTAQLRGVYGLLEMFVGSVAVLMIVVTGFRMVTSGGNEEVVNKSKKQITWAIIGLVVIGLSELVVKDIIFPKEGSTLPDVIKAQQTIVTITNFASSFIASVAIAMYMYGGYLYVTAAGKEDSVGKAKKVLIGATIGLVIALGAYGIVNTVINVEPLIPGATQQSLP